jgi:peroxiredoxin
MLWTHHYEGLTLRSYIPSVIFKMRVRDESIGGPNPYKWQDVSTWDLFAGKRVLVFSLPGAFTPTCSTYQLPDFDRLYPEFKALGIEDIYCVSVNDAFVMNAWAKQQNVSNVKMLPDGSQKFTTRLGMLVSKDNLGFGFRSWRYAIIVNNGKIEKWFVEPGMEDDAEDDPYGVTSPENILSVLKNRQLDPIERAPF